jgi:hypothetical protein
MRPQQCADSMPEPAKGGEGVKSLGPQSSRPASLAEDSSGKFRQNFFLSAF